MSTAHPAGPVAHLWHSTCRQGVNTTESGALCSGVWPPTFKCSPLLPFDLQMKMASKPCLSEWSPGGFALELLPRTTDWMSQGCLGSNNAVFVSDFMKVLRLNSPVWNTSLSFLRHFPRYWKMCCSFILEPETFDLKFWKWEIPLSSLSMFEFWPPSYYSILAVLCVQWAESITRWHTSGFQLHVMHSTGCFLGHCLIKLPPIACQPSEQIGESLSHILCHFLFQRALIGVTPVQRDDKGKYGTFCYSCVQTSEYFRTAFFCPADLLREHLSSHHSLSPTSLPLHPQSLPNAASLSPFLWPSTKELLSLGYWLPSRRLSAHLPPRFSSLTHSQVLVQVGRKTSCHNFLVQPC